MGLENIDVLKSLGELSVRDKSKGRHIMRISVNENKRGDARYEVMNYLTKQRVSVDSFDYNEKNGVVVVKYHDAVTEQKKEELKSEPRKEEAKSKANTRGSPGCTDSMIPSYRPRD